MSSAAKHYFIKVEHYMPRPTPNQGIRHGILAARALISSSKSATTSFHRSSAGRSKLTGIPRRWLWIIGIAGGPPQAQQQGRTNKNYLHFRGVATRNSRCSKVGHKQNMHTGIQLGLVPRPLANTAGTGNEDTLSCSELLPVTKYRH